MFMVYNSNRIGSSTKIVKILNELGRKWDVWKVETDLCRCHGNLFYSCSHREGDKKVCHTYIFRSEKIKQTWVNLLRYSKHKLSKTLYIGMWRATVCLFCLFVCLFCLFIFVCLFVCVRYENKVCFFAKLLKDLGTFFHFKINNSNFHKYSFHWPRKFECENLIIYTKMESSHIWSQMKKFQSKKNANHVCSKIIV